MCTPKNKPSKKKDQDFKSKGMVIIPYVEGVSEKVARIMKSYSISTAMKPHSTLRNLLVHPKDKRDPHNSTDVIYSIPCKNCDLSYVGETGRKFGKRLDEHRTEAEKVASNIKTRANRKASQSTVHKSAITDHVVESNHVISWDEAKIVGRESDRYKRWIKEAITIRKQGATMNRDEGQYHLSHVFDDLLVDKTSRNTQPAGNAVAKQHSSTAVNRSSLHQ